MFHVKRIEKRLANFNKIQTISVSSILRWFNNLEFVEILQSLFDILSKFWGLKGASIRDETALHFIFVRNYSKTSYSASVS